MAVAQRNPDVISGADVISVIIREMAVITLDGVEARRRENASKDALVEAD